MWASEVGKLNIVSLLGLGILISECNFSECHRHLRSQNELVRRWRWEERKESRWWTYRTNRGHGGALRELPGMDFQVSFPTCQDPRDTGCRGQWLPLVIPNPLHHVDLLEPEGSENFSAWQNSVTNSFPKYAFVSSIFWFPLLHSRITVALLLSITPVLPRSITVLFCCGPPSCSRITASPPSVL